MSTTVAALDRVILSFPSLLQLPAPSPGKALRSWIQLVRTGTFHSSRYGKFSITKDDLATMLKNFGEVTPKAPTELPVDYDHLSMDPKKPGDGAAAGWMKGLQLREDGEELWTEVEWTPEGATRIENKEYKFVSPSFVKDYVSKADGKKYGPTLLAAAITNHPFLEGMQALTLYNFSAMGDLALTADDDGPTVYHLAEPDQRVTFQPDPERTPELTDEERHQSFVVKSTIGVGDDQFVRLGTLDGTEFGWFRVTQLEPANAPMKQQNSPLPSQQPEKQTEDSMQTTNDLKKKADAFAERVTALSNGCTLRDAISLAMAQDVEGAEAYRLAGIGAELATEPEPAPTLSLSAQPGESFDALAMRYAVEKNVPLRDAVRAAGLARPDLAQAR